MKNRYRVLAILFLIMTIGPSVFWFFLKPADYNGTIDLTENRILTEKPVFDFHSIREFPSKFESYYNDHIPFRSDLIDMFAAIEYEAFGETISSNVIAGEEEWLFYSNPADGSSMNTHKGIDHLTKDEMKQIADRLIEARNQIEQMGIEYVVMLCPNKESVYPEYLPDMIKRISELNRLDLLVAYLHENTDLRVVYPKEALLAEKENNYVYYRQDTHWNQLGGYIGSFELLNELGMEPKPLAEVQIAETESVHHDLRDMGRLGMAMDAEKDYWITGFSEHTFSVTEQDADSLIRYRSNNLNGKKIMIQRDSFATAMTAYIPSFFEESVFVHWRVFESAMIAEEKPDIFVLELVERSLPLLYSYEF